MPGGRWVGEIVKKIKAYEVRDSDEGNCVIAFATNSAAARREGADELCTDWESIESCTRKPAYDIYAPGPVPVMELLNDGWWFECSHCGRRVTSDMADDLDDDGLDPADFVPEPHGNHSVFCSANCAAKHYAHRRANEHAKADLLELFDARFPGATVQRVQVYGQKLEPSPPKGGTLCSVDFTFPGAQYGGTWIFGDSDHAHISSIDVEAFHAWRAALKQGGV
jgi:hypothetical protein